MGSSDEGVQKSREIEKLIRQDEKNMSKEVKLLLLGALLSEQDWLPLRSFFGSSGILMAAGQVLVRVASRQFSSR